MKVFKLISLAILTVSLFAACSSPAYVQKDNSVNFSNYKTYMWVDTRANESDNSNKYVTAFADLSLKNAVNSELQKVGWKEVTSDPDVLLSYDLLVERKVVEQNNPVYTHPYSRVYYNPFTRRWGTIYYPSQFLGYETTQVPVKEGTVTITMIDPKTEKVVWQGWTTEQLRKGKLTDNEIASGVKSIFRKFDVASR
jgi:hypothetical protein